MVLKSVSRLNEPKIYPGVVMQNGMASNTEFCPKAKTKTVTKKLIWELTTYWTPAKSKYMLQK
jgi:hypothetical protein